MKRPNIPALTTLRFFAALLVVIFHYDIGRHLNFLSGVSGFGYEAVTFFFVLSGFILTYAHLEAGKPERLNVSAAAFLTHRIARIAPAYFIGLGLAAPFFIAGYAVHHEISQSQFVVGLLLVPTALQAWFPPAATLWNSPAWSLSVEVFLYASFVPLVRMVRRSGQITLMIAAYILVCSVALARVYLGDNRPANDADWWHSLFAYFPLWHLPQFIFGIALGRLFISGTKLSQRAHEVILLASIFVICAILRYHSVMPMLSSNIVLAPVFGALIFGAARATGPLSRILSAWPLVLLGDASYATYIIHIPLWQWWYRVTVVDLQVGLPPPIDFFCYLLIAVGASVLVHAYVERPARRLLLVRAGRVHLFARPHIHTAKARSSGPTTSA
jgi:peptidoglycan/LPS O-acetylase OafA/YrhL